MKSEKPLVSVIVPIYNSEDKIQQCVDSLINQTLKDIEIILVDDGSTDKSGLIINDIKADDSRIVVIHQKNKGVSAARNIGIEKAQGEFVGFVDSDDYVDRRMYEKLYYSVKQEKSSMGMCRFCTILDGKRIEEVWNFDIAKEDNLAKYIFLNMIGHNDEESFNKGNTLMGSTCRCIYNKDIMDKNNIRFDEEITYAEDLIFNLEYLSRIENISLINDIFYYYKIKKRSLSLGYRDDFYTRIKKLMNKIEGVSSDYDMEKRLSYAWFKYLIVSLRNATKDVGFLDFQKYRNLKSIVKDKENKMRLKEIKFKKLNFDNKIFYIILKDNLMSIAFMFYILRCVKNKLSTLKELRLCTNQE